MARIGRIRAASGASNKYGATRQWSKDDHVFESSFRSIDTLRSQDQMMMTFLVLTVAKQVVCVCLLQCVCVCVWWWGGGGEEAVEV